MSVCSHFQFQPNLSEGSEGSCSFDGPVQGGNKHCYDDAHSHGSNNMPVGGTAAAAVPEVVAAADAAVAAVVADYLHHDRLNLHDHHDDKCDEGVHLHMVVAGEGEFHSGEGDFHSVPFVASGQVSAVGHS